MVNSQDLFGNTPLHIAINHGHKDCTLFLLDNGADSKIKNKFHNAPIHECIVSNQPDILELLITHNSKPNVDLGGEEGSTPLHYCACSDNYECAKILLKNGAKVCKPCNHGFFAVHLAAQKGCNKVLELLIEEGSKIGCSRLRMLTYIDGDNNKPLHAAVQFGNLISVKLCLEYGASIDEKNEIDNATPVHIASAQGSLDILKVMFEKQPELFSEIIHSVDTIQMTPLHKAAMFDHVEVAEFLIEKGAEINALDKEKRSPLLLAASRNCIQIVCHLLSKGVNFHLKDSKLRNLFHLILCPETNGINVEKSEGSNSLIKINVIKALNQITQKLIHVTF